MALLTGLLAALSRLFGRITNTLFGWATIALFGQSPDTRRQLVLSGIALLALAWLAAALGVLFPPVGLFLLAFVPHPEGVPASWVRLGMAAAVAVVPLVTGLLSLLLFAPQERPRGRAVLRALVLGYPVTVGLGLTLVLLLFTVPLLKARALARRFQDEHIPFLVQPGGYPTVLADLAHALERGGLPTRQERPPLLLEAPVRLLAPFVRGSTGRMAADRLALLRGQGLEVLLYPADLVVSGTAATVARARMILVQELLFTAAYLTWSAEGQRLEDHVRAIWRELSPRPDGPTASAVQERLATFLTTLSHSDLAYEEWEVLYRLALQVETRLLRLVRPPTPQIHIVERVVERPPAPAAAPTGAARPAPVQVQGIPILVLAAAMGLLLWRLFSAPPWQRKPGW
ncbi:MAG: hypothetical protein HY689_12640 [Chloroflexi bacterium]|nr:hypothetical protein [Chloroflexota bacterium]